MDLSFPKKEHLCLKRRFDVLLAQGRSFFIYPFRVIYLLKEPDPDLIPVQVAISVRKKQFKHAVTRNLIKRRFRESYRIRKSALHSSLISEGLSLDILMVYGASEVLPFREIDTRMQQIMVRLTEVISSQNVQ
ncbi:MAG: ribonuclease P protein component [Bacteroidia bacterium]|nr:ribonuclease P protein component [Bacteroidia bacterium]